LYRGKNPLYRRRKKMIGAIVAMLGIAPPTVLAAAIFAASPAAGTGHPAAATVPTADSGPVHLHADGPPWG
jgi:hypothetical protein